MERKLAVPASGTGSLLEAMCEKGLPVELVVADRRCRAIDVVAPKYGVPFVLLERTDFSDSFDRVNYTARFEQTLLDRGIGVVAMAGFMTVLADKFFGGPLADDLINIHPSLLPAFKGDHAVRDALAYGVKVTGTTIHKATPEIDVGPIIAQEVVQVMPDDTVEILHERIKRVERRLYPAVIRTLLQQ